jgi:hypothetical protein
MLLTDLPQMTPPTDSHQPDNSHQQHRGAWGLSVIIHALALVGLGWIYSSLPTPAPPASVRTGGIVLAQNSSNRSTEYYDEQDIAQQAKGLPTEQQKESSLDPSTDLSPAATANAASINNIQLPGPESSQASPANVTLGDPLAESKISSRLPGDPVSEEFLQQERARLQARKPVGPVGEVSLFGSEPAQGRSFVFVIDRSKSMGGKGLNALVAAQHQLQAALAGLVETHRFQIVAYHHKRVYFHPTALVRVTRGNESRVNEFFGNLLAVGGTDHAQAVLSGLRFKPDVLFLLTDGGYPEISAGQLTQIRRRASGRTTIHTIQFGVGQLSGEPSFMQRLAKQNGGHFHYVNVRSQ